MQNVFTSEQLNALVQSNEFKVNTVVIFTLKDSTSVSVGSRDIANISVQNDLMATNKVGLGNVIPGIGDVSVYAFALTFQPKNVKRYTIYYYIGDTPITIGTYYPDNISNNGTTVTFKGYDILKKFDKEFKESQINRAQIKTLSARLVEACEICNINPTVTIEDDPDGDAAYSFGTLQGYIMPQQDFDDYRAFVGCIAASCGCNLTAGRGADTLKLISIFRQNDSGVDYAFPQGFSAISENYSRSIVFTSIRFRNYSKLATGTRKDELIIEPAVADDSIERVYKYGKNPFIEPQAMWNEINGRRGYIRARNRIASQLVNSYEFFTLELPPIPVFDVGDTIKIADSSGNWHWLYVAGWSFDGTSVKLKFGDPGSGASATATGGAGMGYATVGGQMAQAINTVEDEGDWGDTKVVKHSQSYLYNTALSDSVSESEKLEKITATHLQADQKLDVLNKSIVQADPIDNGDGTYTYTFLMQTGGEIKVDGSAWSFMVSSTDGRATWSGYNVNNISAPIDVTVRRNDVFGIMTPTFTDMVGRAGNWRSSWEYARTEWTAENVREANRSLYYPIDENTIGVYGAPDSVTTSLIGQTFDLYLQADDVVLQDSTRYSGNFRVGSVEIIGASSYVSMNTSGYHLTGRLTVGDCNIKTGYSSYSWAGEGDTITITLYLKLMGHGNHIAGTMPNLQETITSDSGGSVTILSQDYLKHTDGTINIQASGKAYKWYKQLLENGKYNVNSDNDVDVELDHYLISGYGNTVVDDTTNPTSVDIIGSANNVEDCKDKSEIIIIGSNNDITQFPSVSGVKMDGIFIGNSGTGLMWYKDSNTVKYYEDYVESSLGDTKYTLSGTQSGGTATITLTGTDGQVTTVTVTVPTATSDLTNDSGFITNTVNNLTNYYLKTETYTQTEINNLISQALSGAFVVVDSLPTASASTMNKIYLVPKSSGSGSNLKDEYITVNNNGTYSWELIGDTAVDLTGYVKSIMVNGGTYTVASGTTTITLPNYYTQSQIDTMIADFVESSTLERVEYVQTTPSTYENDTLYVIDDGSDTHVFATIATTGMLSDAIEDSTHRTVTDAEKSSWNGKADASSVYTKTQTDTLLSAKADANNVYTKSEADNLLDDKVDKVTGKGLSTNDFTDALQTKLNGIATGAEVNVQADWNESDNTSDSYIQNKPSNIVSDASYVHTDNNYTTAEKNKLSGISSGAEVNVQSDWNQSDNTADDFIKNKPSIPTALSDLTDDSTHRLVSDTEKSTWNNKSDFSGSYNDLTDKPTIPDELADLTDDSTHRLVTDAEKTTWNGKQNALTFDSTPTDGSSNPVTSDGIYDALSGKADSTDLADYMTKVDPTGSGSLSINRTENTTVGRNSVALGSNNEASGIASIAIGAGNTVTGNQARVIGANNTVGSSSNFVIGGSNTATGSRSNRFIIGTSNSITGNVGSGAIVIGKNNSMSGSASDNILIGNSLVGGSKWNQINMGYLNADNSDAIFTIGNGYEQDGVVTRRNALEVLDTGELVLGANPTGSMDAVPKGYLESKFIMISENDYDALTSYESNATYYVY